MRDGVELASDIWLPTADGRHPLILARTPYLRTQPSPGAWDVTPELAKYFVARGYAVAIQDVRGRGDSGGAFGYHFQEAADGYDTIEWMARQPWSNGRVGMMGMSYLGLVQWEAAKLKPPHLVCLASTAAIGDVFNEDPYVGGAFAYFGQLKWRYMCSGVLMQNSLDKTDWAAILEHRPLLTADEVLGRPLPQYREALEHPTLDDYWKRVLLNEDDYSKIDIPALHVTGWFDSTQGGSMRHWRGMATHSPAATEQFLIVGPWDHIQTFAGGATAMGEMEFSDDSILDMRQIHVEFFDRYLMQTSDIFDHPRARLYVTGRNAWQEHPSYPLPKAVTKKLYLSSQGHANTLNGDGVLRDASAASEPHDVFLFDPKNPVPGEVLIDGTMAHAYDRRPLERREDVLVYTTAPLASGIEVIGPVAVELFAASDARDTDFTAAVLDVYPDGRAVALGTRVPGIIRARYRNGFERSELLTPGTVEGYRIHLGHLAHLFKPGHRVRVEISSSAAPRFNPNQNTGNPIATDTEWRVAHQTIFHDAAHPSALLFSCAPD